MKRWAKKDIAPNLGLSMMLDELMCNNNIQKYDAPNQTANQNIQSIDIASFLVPYFNVVVL